MSSRVPETPLHHRLRRRHRGLRAALIGRYAVRAAAACAAMVALAVLAGVLLAPSEPGAWTRLGVLLAAAGVAITLAIVGLRRHSRSFDGYLDMAEAGFPDLRSWLRNGLDFERRPPEHSSPELARAVIAETARRLDGVPLATLEPPLRLKRPVAALAAAFVAVIACGLLAPSPTARSWSTLWNPASAAAPIALEVEPGSVKITPGAALTVRARVWGSAKAPRLERSEGPPLVGVAEGAAERGGRLWRFDLTQLTREQSYRVRASGAVSPRYQILLAGEPAPLSFEIEVRSPAYARLPVQRGTAARGDLTALAGSRANVVVTFDRDLERLEARGSAGAPVRWTSLTPRRWRGDVTIEREANYELHAVAASGEGRFAYRITPLADAPPVLVVRTPEGDVDLPAGQQVGLEVLGQDDLGLSELRLEYRKDPAAPWTEQSLARFGARPRDARVAARWDVSPLGLLPGETASFRFVLFDDNAVSGRGRSVSPTFELRFPSLADLYERIDERQDGALKSLEKVAEQAQELQESLEKLDRQQPQRASPQSPQGQQRSEELRSAVQRQQELGQKIEEAARELQHSVEHAAERQAFDEELTRKLRELNELLAQVQSQELREAMKRMQEAIEKMDHQALEQELPKLREENQETLNQLQRSIDLIKKLREEEKLQALAQRAEELKAQQDALNREHEKQPESDPKGDPSESKSRESDRSDAEEALAEQQRKAAEESEQLAREAREAAQEQPNAQEREALEQAASEMQSEAAPLQREAAQQSSQKQSQKAKASGQKASESLDRAAKQMRQAAQNAQSQQDQVDLAAVRRAAQDLVSLQRSAEQNMNSGEATDRRADRQTDLSEGTSRVADSLFILGRKTPFIRPSLAEALGRAIQQLSQSGKDLDGGNRARGEEAGRRAGESLNQAVLELREAENSMCSGGQSPGEKSGQKPGQQMGEMGQKQSQINQRSRSMAQRLSEQMRLSAGDREELHRLAEEQARIRQQLEQIQREDEKERKLLGRLDQTQREMKEVEEMLRAGASDGTLEEKQTRILSRLLDAQRSINRRDFDPERESRAGEDVTPASPAPLPSDLLRETDRLRLDLLKAEADRYPAQYRAFIEAYLRSLNGSRR
jgi:hypothetical protein